MAKAPYLLACPFCGDKPSAERMDDRGVVTVQIVCNSWDDCLVRPFLIIRVKEHASEEAAWSFAALNWNRRLGV